MQNSSKCQVILSISDHHGRQKLDCAPGGEENKGLSRKSKVVAVDVSTESSSSSGDIHSEDRRIESSNHIALDADEDASVLTLLSSRVNAQDVDNTSSISGSIVSEGGSGQTVTNSQSFERLDKGAHKGTKLTHASKPQWPKWTVSYMTSLSTMEKVMSYYRALDLAESLTDKDLRSFLEEQLCKEKAGLSDMTITKRLRTKLYVSAKVSEPDSCSICMVEYKDEDEIASLYYCSHEYHAGCIKEWLRKNNLCPMCRALAVIPEDYPCWDGDVRLHQAFFVHLKFAAS